MVDPLVFNIQNYSLNDGPGIRTIVFFKGMPDVVGAVIPNHRNITSRCLIQERIASEKKNVDFANDPVIKKQSLSMRKGKQRLRKVYVQTAFPVPKYARQWQ